MKPKRKQILIEVSGDLDREIWSIFPDCNISEFCRDAVHHFFFDANEARLKSIEFSRFRPFNMAVRRKLSKCSQSSWERMIIPHIQALYKGEMVEQEILCDKYNGDFYFPAEKLLVEIDGIVVHEVLFPNKEREVLRRNLIMEAGIDILYINLKTCNEEIAKKSAEVIYEELSNRTVLGFRKVYI